MNSLILLGILGLIVWFWLDTLRSQEIAKAVCKQLCVQSHLQLLDDTITLVQVRLKRYNRGRLIIQRVYYFEFSDSGNNRQRGTLIMRGIHLEMVELPGYMERTISPV